MKLFFVSPGLSICRIRKGALCAIVLLGMSAMAAGVSGLLPNVAVAVSGSRNTVSSARELRQAVEAAADGAVIRMAPGRYPSIVLTNVRKSGNVTITSADQANPAVIARLTIRNCAGLTLRDLELAVDEVPTGTPSAGGEDGYLRPPGGSPFFLSVAESERITLDRLNVHGPVDRPPATNTVSSLIVRNSRNVTVSNSRFSFMRHGLAMLEVDGFRALSNDFSDLRTDAIRGGNASNVEIAYNVMTDFFPAPGDHPDGIQLWAVPNTTSPMENISIHDNIVARGRGESTQGIFIRNVKNELTFRNVTIRNNLVMGGMGNGIAVNSINGALIEGNQVINYPDRKTSWIRLDNSKSVTLRGNVAPKFLITRSEVEDSRNKIDNPGKIDEPLLVSRWLDAQPGRRRANSALQLRMTKSAR